LEAAPTDKGVADPMYLR